MTSSESSQQASPPPFYMYVALQSIHTPLEVPQVYQDLYPSLPAGSEKRLILAMVTALDDTVGNITTALKENPAIWDNTLLIFHSDNGGDTHGNNFPLRAGKFTLWQGGLNVVGVAGGGSPQPLQRCSRAWIGGPRRLVSYVCKIGRCSSQCLWVSKGNTLQTKPLRQTRVTQN